MCPPARRTFLATCGLALAAGCVGTETPDEPTETSNGPTETPGGSTKAPDESTETPDESAESNGLHVVGVEYRTGFLYPTHPDAATVRASETIQFVFLAVETDSRHAPEAFELVIDGGEETSSPTGAPLRQLTDQGWVADRGLQEWVEDADWTVDDPPETLEQYQNRRGLLAFTVPTDVGPVESVELVVEDSDTSAEWAFPAEAAAKLGKPPAFEASLTLPEEIRWESEFQAEIEVANEGGREGRFSAMFGIEDPMHPRTVQVAVPPGETKTETVQDEFPSRFESRPEEPPESVTYQLDTGIELIEESTPVIE